MTNEGGGADEDNYEPKLVYNSAMDKLMGTNGVPHSGHRADLWYEFVITLQNGYCHPGGVLQVTFSGASAATAWARMTTSHVTDSSGFFHVHTPRTCPTPASSRWRTKSA